MSCLLFIPEQYCAKISKRPFRSLSKLSISSMLILPVNVANEGHHLFSHVSDEVG